MSNRLVPSPGGNPFQIAPGQFSPGPSWEPAGPPERGDQAIQQLVARTRAAVLRYKWLILAVFVVGSATGIALTQFVKPKYGVDGTIWISEGGGPNGPVQAPGLITSELGWTDLARSFTVLDAVVSRLSLYVIPKSERDSTLFRNLLPSDSLQTGRFRVVVDGAGRRYELVRRPETTDGEEVVVERGAVGDSIGRSVGFIWRPDGALLPAGESFDFEVVTPREAAVKLQQEMSVSLPLNSNLMHFSLRGEHSVTISRTLNEVMRQFAREAERLKKENLVAVANTIDEQLSDAARALSERENALESFKINTITQPNENVAISPGIAVATNPVMNAYFSEKGALDNVRSDRALLDRILQEAAERGGRLSPEALRGAPNLLAAGETGRELNAALVELSLRQANLRAYRTRYTDEAPTVRRVIDSIATLEASVIPSIARKLQAELKANESELIRRIDAASSELKKIPQRTIEEQRRTRDVVVAATIFQDLQNRAVTARLSEKTVMPDVGILDTAVAPRRPTSDTTSDIVVIAIVASLLVGLALAILLDRLDGRFRYPEQAVNDLGLDVVGAVPSYTAPRTQRQRLEQASQMIESFRSLALSVRSQFPVGSPVQLTISSPGPGDGKSTVSLNLANALAEGGYRTLLIDGDIRRGQLHESCPPVQQTPGLLDYLAGEATLSETIKVTELHFNLSLMPCGARRKQGPELLASQRTTQMLRELQSQFDAIVVDCAPLGAGIDAYAMGSATGAMLVVLRAGETDRRLASAKLATLDRLPVRILGAVLNDIGQSPEFQYYHYLEGYGDREAAQNVALIGEGAKKADGDED